MQDVAYVLVVSVAIYAVFKVSLFLYRFLAIFFSLWKQGIPWAKPALTDITRRDTHNIGCEHAAELGGIFFTQIAHLNMVIISDPYFAAEVLDRTKTPHIIDKPTEPQFYKMMDEGTADPPTPSLISTTNADPYWKIVRKGTSRAFTVNNLRAVFEVSRNMTKRLVTALKAHGPTKPLNLDAVVQNQAFDVIGDFGFSKDYGATDDLWESSGAKACLALKNAMQCAVERTRKPYARIPYTQLWNKHQKAKVTLLRIFKDLLQEVQARGEPAEGENSIAAHLMRTHDEKGQPIPDVRIWSELSIFFFAGVETTGHTMAWVLHLISQHPEVEAKVLAELEELQLLASPQRPSPRPIEYTDLNRLTYLSCCIKESMRLYPVVPIIFRKAMRKLRVGSFTIPKGAFFIVHIMATHTSERYWERAADFLPERWLDPNCEYARPVNPKSRYVPTGPADLFAADKPVNGKCHTQKPVNGHACAPNGISPHEPHMDVEHKVKRWFPYGEGNRQCIGMPLARVNVQASVASLLSTFKFELADEMGGAEGVQKAQTYNITLAPEKGLMMHCIPRVSSANS